jgi:hypothetical protein
MDLKLEVIQCSVLSQLLAAVAVVLQVPLTVSKAVLVVVVVIMEVLVVSFFLDKDLVVVIQAERLELVEVELADLEVMDLEQLQGLEVLELQAA